MRRPRWDRLIPRRVIRAGVFISSAKHLFRVDGRATHFNFSSFGRLGITVRKKTTARLVSLSREHSDPFQLLRSVKTYICK